MSRAAWIPAALALLVLAGLQLAPPAAATTVSTDVEVANVAPTVESHRVSTVSDDGAWVTWVWVSDANGIEDLETVELVEDGRTLAAAEAPTWTGEGVARYTLEVPASEDGAGDRELRVRDAAGAVDAVAVERSLEGVPAGLASDASAELRSVPAPGLGALLAIVGVLLTGRGPRRPRPRARPRRPPARTSPARPRSRRRGASAGRAR